MAHLHCLENFLVIGCKQFLEVFSVDDGSCTFSYVHEFDKAITDGNNKPLDDRLEDLCTSPDGKYICAVYSDKRLVVMTFLKKWEIVKVITVKRRPTAMCFGPKSKLLFVADKSGDLYQYDIQDEIDKTSDDSQEPKDLDPILGHVSMLLDVKVSMDGKYILTADRDEKIRVSELGRPYVIEGFCLGHTEFVCAIEPVPCEKGSLILSSSGDGTIRLWDVLTGKECEKYEFQSCGGSDVDETKKQIISSLITCCSSGNFFAAASSQYNMAKVSIFSLNSENFSFAYQSSFEISNFAKVEDLRFCCGENDKLLYVLGTLKDGGNLALLAYKLDEINVCSLVKSKCLETIETNLSGVMIETKDIYPSLFKVKSDGEVYSSYQKKKEERISATLQNNGVSDAKRVKLDTNS